MADVVTSLPELRWRDLPPVPCDSTPFEFSHSQADRRFPYIDGASHDWTGLDPLPIHAKLYFIETIREGLFSNDLKLWLEALLDGTAGTLEHPILGTVNARVLNGSVPLVASVRGGVIVDVTWTTTVDDPDAGSTFEFTPIEPGAAAKAADAALEAVGIDYPTGEPDLSLLEAYESIKGQIGSALTTVVGKITQVMGTVTGLIEDVNNLDDPSTWVASNTLIAFWNSLDNLKTAVSNSQKRATAKIITTTDTTLDTFAASVGNTVEEVMGLNLSALRLPSIPKGTELVYYTS